MVMGKLNLAEARGRQQRARERGRLMNDAVEGIAATIKQKNGQCSSKKSTIEHFGERPVSKRCREMQVQETTMHLPVRISAVC